MPVKATMDEQLPDPSGPLSKPVPSLRPPKTIANVLKEKDGASTTLPGHMGHRLFTSCPET